MALDPACTAYRDRILAQPVMVDWKRAAMKEPDEADELDVEFLKPSPLSDGFQ